MLELISKSYQLQAEVYNFILNGENISRNYTDSLRLINYTKSSDRNLRVINGVISLKKGQLPAYGDPKRHRKVLRIYTKKRTASGMLVYSQCRYRVYKNLFG